MVKIIKEVNNPFELAKKERLEWLFNYLTEKKNIPYLELLSMLQIKFGVSENTAKAYIRVIVSSNKFFLKHGIVSKKNE